MSFLWSPSDGSGPATPSDTQTATLTTSSTTPATLHTLTGTPPTDGMTYVKATVWAGGTSGGKFSFEISAAIEYASGTATISLLQADFTYRPSDPSVNATITVSGADIRITVTGKSNQVDWECKVTRCDLESPVLLLGINQPTFPTSVDVALGPAWVGYSTFFLGQVVTLLRVSISATEVVYTEDGTLTPAITNRIRITMKASQSTTTDNTWDLLGYMNSTPSGSSFVGVTSLTGTSVSSSGIHRYESQPDVLYDFLQVMTSNTAYGSNWPKVFQSMVAGSA